MVATYFKIGDWKAECAECGAARKSSELKLTWDGFHMCHICWQPRHPQDFVRATPPAHGVPWANNRPPPTFVNPDTRPDGSDPTVIPLPIDSP